MTAREPHTGEREHSNGQSVPRSIPSVAETGLGYQYVRCRAGETDETVYVHQLVAISDGAEPENVFSNHWDVQHRPLHEWLDLEVEAPASPCRVGDLHVPPLDVPEGVELEPKNEFRGADLQSGLGD